MRMNLSRDEMIFSNVIEKTVARNIVFGIQYAEKGGRGIPIGAFPVSEALGPRQKVPEKQRFQCD